jgi:plasmid stability protein
MAQLVVRNIEDDVKARLVRRARRHGRSMEEEVRDILREAVKYEDVKSGSEGLGTQLTRLFAGIGLEEPLHEFKGHTVKPVEFD